MVASSITRECTAELCNVLNSFLTECRANGLGEAVPDLFNVTRNPLSWREITVGDNMALVSNEPNESVLIIRGISSQEIRCTRMKEINSLVPVLIFGFVQIWILLFTGDGSYVSHSTGIELGPVYLSSSTLSGPIARRVSILTVRIICTVVSFVCTAMLTKVLRFREPREITFYTDNPSRHGLGTLINALVFDKEPIKLSRNSTIRIGRSQVTAAERLQRERSSGTDFVSGRRFSLSVNNGIRIDKLTEEESLYLAHKVKELQSRVIQ